MSERLSKAASKVASVLNPEVKSVRKARGKARKAYSRLEEWEITELDGSSIDVTNPDTDEVYTVGKLKANPRHARMAAYFDGKDELYVLSEGDGPERIGLEKFVLRKGEFIPAEDIYTQSIEEIERLFGMEWEEIEDMDEEQKVEFLSEYVAKSGRTASLKQSLRAALSIFRTEAADSDGVIGTVENQLNIVERLYDPEHAPPIKALAEAMKAFLGSKHTETDMDKLIAAYQAAMKLTGSEEEAPVEEPVEEPEVEPVEEEAAGQMDPMPVQDVRNQVRQTWKLMPRVDSTSEELWAMVDADLMALQGFMETPEYVGLDEVSQEEVVSLIEAILVWQATREVTPNTDGLNHPYKMVSRKASSRAAAAKPKPVFNQKAVVDGLQVLYSPVNQAWLVMVLGQTHRILNESFEVLLEVEHLLNNDAKRIRKIVTNYDKIQKWMGGVATATHKAFHLKDNLLEGFSYEDLVTTIQGNEKDPDKGAVSKVLREMIDAAVADANAMVKREMKNILDEVVVEEPEEDASEHLPHDQKPRKSKQSTRIRVEGKERVGAVRKLNVAATRRGSASKKLVIEDSSGRFWTGETWGVRQNAEIYESEEELPSVLEEKGEEDLTLEIFSSLPSLDARYYVDGADDSEASVEVLR